MGEPLTSAPTGSRDLAALSSWHADWSGLRVAVLGLGVTGFSVADTLVELGADVLVVAASSTDENRRLVDVIGARFESHADESVIPDAVSAFDPEVVVVSPGYRPDHPLLSWAMARGTPVWGDIELAWRVRDKVRAAEWIQVTGTIGKTTVAELTARMLLAAGVRAAPAGAIGIPVLDAIRDPQGFDVLVVELSSAQLHWFAESPGGTPQPLASVCLNLEDAHLDWHGSAERYRAAKARVYEHTRVACVFNQADDATRAMVEEADVEEGCRAIGFSLGMPGPSDLGLVEDILVDRAFLEERHTSALELATLADLTEAGLSAPFEIADVLAAAALARAADVPPSAVRSALRSLSA